MNSLEKGVLTIIKSALTGECYELPEDFDISKLVEVARFQQMCPIIYFGALNCKISSDNPIIKKLYEDTFAFSVVSEMQMLALNNICEAFEQNKIDYMLLKGAQLKGLYPKPEMRTMADVDILIKTAQYNDILPLMVELGFVEKCQSDHEYVWVNGKITIELHTKLIPSYNQDYYEYFGEGWQKAKKKLNSTSHKMCAEDEFIFVFTHLAKHYRDAGIGLKNFIDIYLYINKLKLNEEYVLTELKNLHLDVFYKNVVKTLKNWFDNEKETEITRAITQKVFSGGVYGGHDERVLSDALKKTSNKKSTKFLKIKKIFFAIFSPYTNMCKKYPKLKKTPFLLPAFWIIRWMDVLFFQKERINKKISDLKLINEDDVKKYKKDLNLVGLDYNFKEK